jgi:hypothetical protein
MTPNNDTAETRDGGFDPEDVASVPTGRNIISVIGINDYQEWKKLNNAVSDAQGIRKLFVETFAFEEPVPHLFNNEATKEAITSLVEDQLRNELKEDDALILFFAGHGHTRVDKVGKKEIEIGFIVPVEARGDQWGDYLKMNDWLEAISTLPARHVLVILDACHSGFGVGEVMQIFREAVRYEQDLVRRVSRKVFTSAQRDQLALDGGPVAGHSLFTGTLINGLNWGKADLDGNGLITGSELGLYIQQQVGQYSQSKQTPNFGNFPLDERGEIVIKLHDNSFDTLKARTFAALQQADMDRFSELVAQVTELRPDSPETLYLQYRLAFYRGHIDQAAEIAERLYDMGLNRGTIPLSEHDLWEIKVQIPYWRNILAIPPGDSPLKIEISAGKDRLTLKLLTAQPLGTINGYIFELGTIFRINVTNLSDMAIYVYIIQITTAGRLEFIPPWKNPTTALQPGESRDSYLFKSIGEPGLFEMRFYTSPVEIPELLSPPSVTTRAVVFHNEVSDEDVAKLRTQTIYGFSVLPSSVTEAN